MFVDRVNVTLQAGDGGDGVTSFRHEKFRKMGGPDGGDGGDGGDVVLAASRNQNTLAALRYKKLLKAESGRAGGKARKHGKSGQDLEVAVPVGTVVADKTGEVLVDLTTDGQKTIIAHGGQGGFGNAHFVSSTRQAPRVAEKGEKGQTVDAVLELKMIADVGIVGLPNAGKSTLLSVISNAKPEIADYPFTTLVPNLGVVDIDRQISLLFADIPGLIEGASQGKGLGDEFLRHVERTSVLVHLIDAYSDDIAQAYTTVLAELQEYKIDLSKKPQLVVLTKTEGLDKKELEPLIKQLKKVTPRGTPILAISSASRQGLPELLRAVQKRVQQSRKKTKAVKKPKLPVIKFTPRDEDWQVTKTNDSFVVTGAKIERFARRTKFGDFHSEQRLRDILGKMGIMRELERRSVEPDQKIIIGDPHIGHIFY